MTSRRPSDRPPVEFQYAEDFGNCLLLLLAPVLAYAGLLGGFLVRRTWDGAWQGALIVPAVLLSLIRMLQHRALSTNYVMSRDGISVRRDKVEVARYAWDEVAEVGDRPPAITLHSGRKLSFTSMRGGEWAADIARYFRAGPTAPPETVFRYFHAMLKVYAMSNVGAFADPPWVDQAALLHARLEALYGRPLLSSGMEQDTMLKTIIPLPNAAGQYPQGFCSDPADPEGNAYWAAPCALYLTCAGPLVMLDREENCAPERLQATLALLREGGFDYVPSEFFQQAIPGQPAHEEYQETWHDRFFSYT